MNLLYMLSMAEDFFGPAHVPVGLAARQACTITAEALIYL